MNYVEQQAPYRRGRFLAILSESNDQGCSVPVLRTLVRDWGYRCDADTAAIDIAWLQRHGLITQRDVGGVAFARISERGRDVVRGDLDLPGVSLVEGG